MVTIIIAIIAFYGGYNFRKKTEKWKNNQS